MGLKILEMKKLLTGAIFISRHPKTERGHSRWNGPAREVALGVDYCLTNFRLSLLLPSSAFIRTTYMPALTSFNSKRCKLMPISS